MALDEHEKLKLRPCTSRHFVLAARTTLFSRALLGSQGIAYYPEADQSYWGNAIRIWSKDPWPLDRIMARRYKKKRILQPLTARRGWSTLPCFLTMDAEHASDFGCRSEMPLQDMPFPVNIRIAGHRL